MEVREKAVFEPKPATICVVDNGGPIGDTGSAVGCVLGVIFCAAHEIDD